MDKEITIPKSDFYDIISDALATGGRNCQQLSPDGTVGQNIRRAFLEFLAEAGDKDEINLMIRLLKVGGYNDQLMPDGEIGEQLHNAINNLLEENGQLIITDEEINQMGE